MTPYGAIDLGRFELVRQQWLAITQRLVGDDERFAKVKAEAAALVDAGHWTSGPDDMLRVLRRQRDELIHSRLLGWLLVPTNRHGLGRAFLNGLSDHLWPGEELMRTGPVIVDLEVPGAGLDEEGRIRTARADIVIRGESATIVIENKLDAGEQPDQCERLYWGWSGEPGDTRWVFLTPSGRAPLTTTSQSARNAWRTLGYRDLLGIYAEAIGAAARNDTIGRATALQYRATLEGVFRR